MTTEESSRGFFLENVLDKLLDLQAAEGADCLDGMLLLSLVNLLGIVSLLNKQSGVTAAAQAPGAMNPLLGMLLNMLSGGGPEARGSEPGSSPDAFVPATLMNMFNAGKAPDPAALMKLMSNLGSLMGSFGKPPVSASVPEQSVQPEQNPGAIGSGGGAPGRVKEIKKPEGPLKWDSRLGKATG